MDMETALVAYNAGEGNVSKWLNDKNFSDDGKRLKNIPFKESREYITKIKENAKKYNKLYKKILDKYQIVLYTFTVRYRTCCMQNVARWSSG